jgi:outer membrane protein OmpA-like peptidoglycan-associated protein/tetratricopeptide (TPR) repeat protein
MRRFLLFITLLLSMNAFAQRVAIDYGDIYFEFFQFKEAAKYYQEALTTSQKPKQRQYLLEQLSQCYKYLFEYRKSEEYFKQLMNSGEQVKPEFYIDYGNILKLNGKYDEARKQFKKYQEVTGTDLAEQFIRSVNWAIRNSDTIKNYDVFPTNLDISGQALGYCFYDDGLIYSHARNKQKQSNVNMPVFDLDYARKEGNTEFKADLKIMDFIEFSLNEGSPSVSADGMTLFFSANSQKVKAGKSKSVGGIKVSSDGVSNFQIYAATNEGGMFQNPQPLSFNDEDYSFVHPFIMNDGNTLFFSSNMPGGFGGFDIWKSVKDETGKWGEPVNMGKVVNTEENELFPIYSDGLFYFTSKGFNNYGGYDIFVTNMNKFLLPSNLKNLGQPINSYRDDVAFITRDGGRTGYFSSNRDNEEGADYVYYFNETAPKDEYGDLISMVDTSLAPVNIPGSLGINAQKVAVPSNAGQQQPASATSTGVNGATAVAGGVGIVGGAAVIAGASKTNKQTANTKAGKSTTASSSKTSPTVTAPIGLSSQDILNRNYTPVQFRFNDASINASQMQAADSVVALLKAYPGYKVYVSAHADSRGPFEYNLKLTERRAATVRNYLMSKGVPASRILTRGLGESQLLNECADGVVCTEAQHAINRRVELKIVR